jgi:hypothetical protein
MSPNVIKLLGKKTNLNFITMNNQATTAVISITEQGKIMGGADVGPKPKKPFPNIKDILKPTPTIPYPTTSIPVYW